MFLFLFLSIALESQIDDVGAVLLPDLLQARFPEKRFSSWILGIGSKSQTRPLTADQYRHVAHRRQRSAHSGSPISAPSV
jgi:hypothetical protein